MADALSQKALLLTIVRTKVLGFNILKESLIANPFFSPIFKDVIAGQQEDFLVHDEFLFKGNRLCISEESLRFKIIQEMHNEGHMGHDKMHNEGHIYGL